MLLPCTIGSNTINYGYKYLFRKPHVPAWMFFEEKQQYKLRFGRQYVS